MCVLKDLYVDDIFRSFPTMRKMVKPFSPVSSVKVSTIDKVVSCVYTTGVRVIKVYTYKEIKDKVLLSLNFFFTFFIRSHGLRDKNLIFIHVYRLTNKHWRPHRDSLVNL